MLFGELPLEHAAAVPHVASMNYKAWCSAAPLGFSLLVALVLVVTSVLAREKQRRVKMLAPGNLWRRTPHQQVFDPAVSFGRSVRCGICGKEVARSRAIVPRAQCYLVHFCGLDCYASWIRRIGIS